jgi:hypothetical protein
LAAKLQALQEEFEAFKIKARSDYESMESKLKEDKERQMEMQKFKYEQ